MLRFFHFFSYLIAIATLSLAPAACDSDPKTVDSCGDQFTDPGEDCDGSSLGTQTCTSVGYYNATGVLACNADCTFDTSDCGGHCGDDVIDGAHNEQCEGPNLSGASCETLNFSRGGTLSCGADCRYDTTLCLSTCGNGNREPDEPCDDHNTEPGDGCDATCAVETGWTCSGDTVSVCAQVCPAGLSWCDGTCFDLFNDPAHCGTCDHACSDDLPCIGGVCRSGTAAWVDAGQFGPAQTTVPAARYDITPCPGGPFLFVQTEVAEVPREQSMFQLGVSTGQWAPVPALNPQLPEGGELDPGLAVTCIGAQKVAAYSVLAETSSELIVRYYDTTTMTWTAFGSASLVSECWRTDWIDLAADTLDRLHILSRGSWTCADALDYAWWDGQQWQAHPSRTSSPRQIADYASGNPAMAVRDDQVFFGTAVYAGDDMVDSEHRVLQWIDDDWNVSAPLDSDPTHGGFHEHMTLAADGERLCAAWLENASLNSIDLDVRVFVRCFDDLTATWLPEGDAAMVSQDHQAEAPSLVIAGAQLYLAYLASESDGQSDYWHARVVRRDPQTLAWEIIGLDFEADFTISSRMPRLIVHEGQVFLSYLDSDQDMSNLHILRP